MEVAGSLRNIDASLKQNYFAKLSLSKTLTNMVAYRLFVTENISTLESQPWATSAVECQHRAEAWIKKGVF